MVLARKADGGTVATEEAVLKVDGCLTYHVIGGHPIIVPHLYLEVFMKWQGPLYLKYTGKQITILYTVSVFQVHLR